MKKLLLFIIIVIAMARFAPQAISQAGQKLSTLGNPLTTGEFMGSTNLYPIIIKTNNKEWMRISETGNVGIGIIAPTDKLHVAGTARMQYAKVDADLTALNVITQKLNAAVSAVIGNLTLSNGSISSSSGAINFGANNLSTTGAVSGSNISTLQTTVGSQQGQITNLNTQFSTLNTQISGITSS